MKEVAVSIGTVARLTGIPVETLRTWERRYGFPKPQRSAGGHRLYRPETVETLQLIARAIANGHRASTVVGLPPDELDAVLARDAASGQTPLPSGDVPPVREDDKAPASSDASAATQPILEAAEDADAAARQIAEWIDAVAEMDADVLDHGFRSAWGRLGTLEFLSTRLAPFLDEVGTAWSSGRITVSQEHFAGERARHFLFNIWRPVAEHNGGSTLLLSTLPGESHDLGLHMAACVAAETGARIVFLGAATPIADIVSAARQARSRAVLISVSRSADADSVRGQLRSLRANLPRELRLVIGGGGAPDDVDGVHRFDTLRRFREWLGRGMPETDE